MFCRLLFLPPFSFFNSTRSENFLKVSLVLTVRTKEEPKRDSLPFHQLVMFLDRWKIYLITTLIVGVLHFTKMYI